MHCILKDSWNVGITDTGVAHSCASLLRDNGEAVFALAFGYGGDGGLLLVKLPVTGSAVTTILKRESTVPRFLSGITGALRLLYIFLYENVHFNLLLICITNFNIMLLIS